MTVDHPAFARRVSPLENDDKLELLGLDPVLELDELALQAQQLLEISAAAARNRTSQDVRSPTGGRRALHPRAQARCLVKTVLNIGVHALLELADPTLFRARLVRAHFVGFPYWP